MVCGFQIPSQGSRLANADGGECMISGPITSRQRWSFSAWVARQPVKLGGMGLRSFEELCQPAYLGAMEQALPRLHTGFCKVLEDVVGGDDAFGEAASGDGRWRTLLASGSRVGEEFGTAWRSLQGEAYEISLR